MESQLFKAAGRGERLRRLGGIRSDLTKHTPKFWADDIYNSVDSVFLALMKLQVEIPASPAIRPVGHACDLSI